MDVRTGTPYKYYFWKRFFLLFIPLFLIGALPDPFITGNPFASLEDYGEFAFAICFYLSPCPAFLLFSSRYVGE